LGDADHRTTRGCLEGRTGPAREPVREVAEQHRRISDAITDRDAEGAAAAMRDHLRWAAKADLHGRGEPAVLRFELAAGT
jgi:DNA-binding FadR family transcriptional regulator